MTVLLAATLLTPLMLAGGLSNRVLRPVVLMLAAAAPLPALLLVTQPVATLDLPWLLLGMRLGVDAVNAPFLLLAGLLWTIAGLYSRCYLASDPEPVRFYCFFLLTLTGNLGLILALDMVSFYLFFTLMTFSAYGLIVHDNSPEARRAGRVYLVLAVLGELLLLTAIWLLAAGLGNASWQPVAGALVAHPQRDWIMGLVLVGFAIKVGVAPLHVWLPLAHSYAPTPASAVLSGIMIKAGVLGWMRFLPLGAMALPDWGQVIVAVGLFATFYGVLCGLPQARAKTVLAYSSVSQMGLITTVLGIALTAPQHAPFLAATLSLFSLHHGLAKGALFLGVGIAAQGTRLAGWLLLLPALALAGAPLSSGYLAKRLLKDAIPLAPGLWPEWLPLLLTLSSGATTLLMARFLYLAWPIEQRRSIAVGLWLPWLGLLATSLVLPWLWSLQELPGRVALALQPEYLLSSAAPLLATLPLAALVWIGGRRWNWRLPVLPEGDIVVWLTAPARYLPRWQSGRTGGRVVHRRRSTRYQAWLAATEHALQQLGISGMLLLLLGIGFIVLLAVG